jgi:hypothetical protein
MPSHASDNLGMAFLCKARPVRGTTIDVRRRTFLCRASPMRGMAIGSNADRLQTNWISERQARMRSHGGLEKKRRTGQRINTDFGAAPTSA